MFGSRNVRLIVLFLIAVMAIFMLGASVVFFTWNRSVKFSQQCKKCILRCVCVTKLVLFPVLLTFCALCLSCTHPPSAIYVEITDFEQI